ncbi:MAG: porin [Gammaproteobacteria bacterium]
MSYKKITVCCMLIFGVMQPAIAVEVAGKKLEVYGKAHLSIDSVDADDPAVTTDGLSVSSNSSRLGFKGELPAGALKFIFQYEQEVVIDESGSQLATRNTYAGIKGGFGKLFAGHYDTPYKTVASKWGLFGDTVGERRAILGAGYKSGNKLNVRAKNAIVYEFNNQNLKLQLMHAVDPETKGASDGKYDNNDKSVTSVGLFYKIGNLWLAASQENWKKHSKMDNGDALRLAASYKFANVFKLGLLYESINSDTVDEWKRDATGINAKLNISKATDIRVQYLIVDSADNTTDTGATKIGLGLFHTLDKKAKVYLAYGATDNDANAKFQAVDGGHGDEVKTRNGGNPSALSIGLIYKF